jgi:hypothetical protein
MLLRRLPRLTAQGDQAEQHPDEQAHARGDGRFQLHGGIPSSAPIVSGNGTVIG